MDPTTTSYLNQYGQQQQNRVQSFGSLMNTVLDNPQCNCPKPITKTIGTQTCNDRQYNSEDFLKKGSNAHNLIMATIRHLIDDLEVNGKRDRFKMEQLSNMVLDKYEESGLEKTPTVKKWIKNAAGNAIKCKAYYSRKKARISTDRPTNIPLMFQDAHAYLPQVEFDMDSDGADTPMITNEETPVITNNNETDTPVITNDETDMPVITNDETYTPVITNNETDMPVITNDETDMPVITNDETDTPMITNNETDMPVITNNETDTPVITNDETDMPVITNNETDTPVITNDETDTPVISNGETDMPVITNNETDTAMITNNETDTPVISNDETDTPVIPVSYKNDNDVVFSKNNIVAIIKSSKDYYVGKVTNVNEDEKKVSIEYFKKTCGVLKPYMTRRGIETDVIHWNTIIKTLNVPGLKLSPIENGKVKAILHNLSV